MVVTVALVMLQMVLVLLVTLVLVLCWWLPLVVGAGSW